MGIVNRAGLETWVMCEARNVSITHCGDFTHGWVAEALI